MTDLEKRLQYIEETKDILRTSINSVGGTLEEDTEFSEYPNQISYIIDNIVSQEDINNLVDEIDNINGGIE